MVASFIVKWDEFFSFFFFYSMCWDIFFNYSDYEGKTDLKIRALEVVEELRTKRADKQVSLASLG